MGEQLRFENWGEDMTDDLRRLFVGDEEWPLAPESLAALTDLGMPDEKIADYFGVEAEKVSALRHRHGLERSTRREAANRAQASRFAGERNA